MFVNQDLTSCRAGFWFLVGRKGGCLSVMCPHYTPGSGETLTENNNLSSTQPMTLLWPGGFLECVGQGMNDRRRRFG